MTFWAVAIFAGVVGIALVVAVPVVTAFKMSSQRLGAARNDSFNCPPVAGRYPVAELLQILAAVTSDDICQLDHGVTDRT